MIERNYTGRDVGNISVSLEAMFLFIAAAFHSECLYKLRFKYKGSILQVVFLKLLIVNIILC